LPLDEAMKYHLEKFYRYVIPILFVMWEELFMNNLDELPLSLKVSDISKILDISLGNAYVLCHSEEFPSVAIGRRIVIPKLAFIKWLENPKQMRE
jgi:hypothetical protein